MTNTTNQHPTLTGAEILWAALVGEGVTTVFGDPGGAILPRLRRSAQVPHQPRAHAAHGRRLRMRLKQLPTISMVN
nr:hypothetical protein [Edaphobacter aggregans]